MRRFEFQVTFREDQDVESKESDIERLYDILDDLFKEGVLADYNCSKMEELDELEV